MVRRRVMGTSGTALASALAIASCAAGCTGCTGDGRGSEGTGEETAGDTDGEPSPVHEIEARPELDRDLSPFTGWTRAHHELVFARVVRGWADSLTEGGARTSLEGGEELPAALEGAARVMPMLGAWLADPQNPAVIRFEGREFDLVAMMRTALLHGTDPTHADYWGAIEDGWDQKSVEAASVCEALWLAEDRLWPSFSELERAQILRWLSPAQSNFPNNWALFVGLRNLTRARLGASWDVAATSAQMTRMDDYYLGDGWYSDGGGVQVDFYNGFVIHHLLALWALYTPDLAPERRALVEARLRAWVSDVPYFYGSDGSRVPFGRSLAYRDAHLSVLALAHRLGVSPLPAGRARRLVSGALAHQVGDDGWGTEGMLGTDDVVARGWRGDDPRSLESYQRPGSQNFSTRALMTLMIPRDDPWWTATEESIPADDGAFAHAMPAAGLTVVGMDAGTEVRLLPSRPAKGNADKYLTRYRKLAYSSRFFPDLGAGDGFYPDDASVTVATSSGVTPPREMATGGTVAPGFSRTIYAIPLEPPHEVVATTWAHADALVRLACHAPTVAGTLALEGGFSVPKVDTTVTWRDDELVALAHQSPVDGAAGGMLASSVRGLAGYDVVAPRYDLPHVGATNMVWDASVTPRLLGEPLAVGEPACTLSVTRAARLDAPLTSAQLEPWTKGPVSAHVLDEAGRAVTLDVGGGQVWLGADAQPMARSVELDGLTFEGPLHFASHVDDEIVATGVSTVHDDTGPLLSLAVPGTVVVERDNDRWRVRADVPFAVRVPFEARIEGVGLDGIGVEVTDAVENGQGTLAGLVSVPHDLHARFSSERERTIATFDFLADAG